MAKWFNKVAKQALQAFSQEPLLVATSGYCCHT